MNLDKYYEFINECKKKKHIKKTHKHHIIPIFLGGTDEKSNIVKLTYEDHKQAHLLLANCFEKGSVEYNNNMNAINYLQAFPNSDDVDVKKKLSLDIRDKISWKKVII